MTQDSSSICAATVVGAGARRRDPAPVSAGLARRGFDAQRELKVGPAAAAAALAAHRELSTGPALPALRRYTGVLYQELDFPGQPAPLRRRLASSTVIVSGLWGLLRGDDPVPAYKLPIGASVPGVGRLAAWWRPRLTPVLAEYLTGAVVWNLLPGAYAAALGPLETARVVWTVRVVRDRDGRRSVVGHDNKAVKGALTRSVIERAATEPGALTDWTGPTGYRIESVTGGVIEVVTHL